MGVHFLRFLVQSFHFHDIHVGSWSNIVRTILVTGHFTRDGALNCGDSPCFCCIERLLYYGHFAESGVLDVKVKNLLTIIIIVMVC